MKYYLMNKNCIVLSFETDASANGQKGAAYKTDDHIITSSDIHLPFGFADIQDWLETRKAPENRKNIKKILIECGALNYDGLIRMTNGASLNDTFWVKLQDSDLTWKDISFYRNDFNEHIGQIAFDGGKVQDIGSPSPELSTGGAYAKCWIRQQDKTYMLKKSSRTYETEAFSEFYGSQLARLICNDAVEYDLCIHHGSTVSKCENFTDEDNSFASLEKLTTSRQSDDHFIKMRDIYYDHGYEDDFNRMIVLDALILNIDRHFGNAGFIYDPDSLEIKRPAPVFDNNRSLLFDKVDDEVEQIRDVRELDVYPRFGMDFNNNAHAVLTPGIKSDLRSLSGFQFKRHEDITTLSEKRLKKIEEMIDQQINNILERKLFHFRDLPPLSMQNGRKR